MGVNDSARFGAAAAAAILVLALPTSTHLGSAEARDRDATKPSTLNATMLNSPDTDARPTFSLEFCNHGEAVVWIPKPMFPSSWCVTRHYREGGNPESQECSGGVVRGVPDPGYPNRYDLSQYTLVNPGECYRSVEDLVFYLTICNEAVLPGEYEIELLYNYKPTADEVWLPIVRGPLWSNRLHIAIAANSRPVGQRATRAEGGKQNP